MRKIALALILAAAPLSAQTPEKTPASAFAFIQSSMADGSWTGMAQDCDEDGYCSDQDGYKITAVQTYGGSYCNLQISMATDNKPYRATRSISLTKNFSIYGGGSTLYFDGPVVMTNGQTVGNWRAQTSNYDARERVLKAFQFLQAACKPATPW